MSSSCPSPAILQALLGDRLGPHDQALWTEHLDGCAACRAKLESLAAADVVPEPRARASAPSSGPSKLAAVIRNLKTSLAETTVGNHPEIPVSLDFLLPSNKPELLGLFGPYEITSLLGQGGMGIVLSGRDPGLRREVAIKVLLPFWAAQASARERFLREARAAASVAHEHVVAIYAVDEERGLPYLVMQQVAGGSLQRYLDDHGPLPANEIARIGAEIAEGLTAAHAKGIVHRDIKPSNILLDGNERHVRISDFGLAKASDDVSLTRTGTLAGTPEYMAPEQAAEGPIDARADLFALGSVLYAMASGRPPFRGDSAYAVIRQVCEVAPQPLASIRQDLPAWLVAMIERLLKKDPADRFAGASEVAAALRSQGAGLAAPQSLLNTPVNWLTGTAMAVLLVAWACYDNWRAREGLWGPGPIAPADGTQPGDVRPAPPAKSPGFYLAGRAEPFAALQEAVQAAPANGIIEVQGDGPFVAMPMQIAGKAITIRAAAGSRPVIESPGGAETPERSLIETDSDLTLAGLALHWLSTERRPRDNETEEVIPHTALAIRGGTLRLARCEIAVAAGNCAVGLYGGSGRIVDSLISSPKGPAVLIHMRSGAEATVDHSILSGRSGIVSWLDDDSQGGGSTSVKLNRVTISAPFAIQCFASGATATELPTNDTPRLHCEGHGCVFDCRIFLVLRPAALPVGSPPRPLRMLGKLTNQANWIGSRNVFSGVETFVHVLRQGRPPFRMTATFDDWRTRTGSDQDSIAATAEFATPGDKREAGDYRLIAVPGLSAEEIKPRGAEVEKVGPRTSP